MRHGFLFLGVVMIMTSCYTAPVTHREGGQSNPPFPWLGGVERNFGTSAGFSTRNASSALRSPRVEIYNSFAGITRMHRITGEIKLSTDGRTSPHAIREFFENEALSRAADGVIIQDPADRAEGSPGPGFDRAREITGTFFKYDTGGW